MGRIWLLRGVAVAVFAVLVGAWAVGLAGIGGSSSSTEEVTTPVSPESSPVRDIQRAIVVERAKPRRTRETDASQEVLPEPSPDAIEEPAADAPGTPDPPGPSDQPSASSPPPAPSNPPSNPPTQPGDDCTDLVAVADCALDPITGQP